LEAVKLESDALSVVVLPELGGKISSLVSRATGREWLWRNPHLPYRAAAPGDSYVALHDTGGIDECFPTVAPSLGFPDHGELWGQAWAVEERSAERLTLSARGKGYRLDRSLRLARLGLELDYRLQSLSDRNFSFVWCLHPLFAIEPGMTIEIGGTVVTRIPAEARTATKTFVESPTRGGVALRTADGREQVTLAFDRAEVPFVGLWQNYRGWSGAGTEPYFNLGLEPSIGDCDSLEEAVTRGTAGVLEAGARRVWRISLSI